MSKYTHIIKQHNPELADIYEKAGSPSKVLCVGLDYAKTNHTAIVCNGEGLILKNAFDVRNNPEGLDFLVERVGRYAGSIPSARTMSSSAEKIAGTSPKISSRPCVNGDSLSSEWMRAQPRNSVKTSRPAATSWTCWESSRRSSTGVAPFWRLLPRRSSICAA